MVVDGYDETGRLLAHTLGGGLQYTIGSHGIVSLRKVSDAELKHPRWRKSRFALEGVPGTFAGWTDGRLWNGWAKPHFEFAEANRLLHSLTELSFRYDSAQDAFVAPDGNGEAESWAAAVITPLEGEPIKVYPIGTGSWCWEEEAR